MVKTYKKDKNFGIHCNLCATGEKKLCSTNFKQKKAILKHKSGVITQLNKKNFTTVDAQMLQHTSSLATACAKMSQSRCRYMSVSWSSSLRGSHPYFSWWRTRRLLHLGPHSCCRLKLSIAASRSPSSCRDKRVVCCLFRASFLSCCLCILRANGHP